jgi:hypothetical protein
MMMMMMMMMKGFPKTLKLKTLNLKNPKTPKLACALAGKTF